MEWGFFFCRTSALNSFEQCSRKSGLGAGGLADANDCVHMEEGNTQSCCRGATTSPQASCPALAVLLFDTHDDKPARLLSERHSPSSSFSTPPPAPTPPRLTVASRLPPSDRTHSGQDRSRPVEQHEREGAPTLTSCQWRRLFPRTHGVAGWENFCSSAL